MNKSDMHINVIIYIIICISEICRFNSEMPWRALIIQINWGKDIPRKSVFQIIHLKMYTNINYIIKKVYDNNKSFKLKNYYKVTKSPREGIMIFGIIQKFIV